MNIRLEGWSYQMGFFPEPALKAKMFLGAAIPKVIAFDSSQVLPCS